MDHSFNRKLALTNHSPRLQNSLSNSTSTPIITQTNHPVSSAATPITYSRNKQLIIQRGDRTDRPNHTRLLQKYVCDSQKEWRFSTSFQSQTIKPTHSGTTLQNGNTHRSDQTAQESYYLTSIDLSDAFLHIPIHPESRPYLRLHWQGKTYQFCTTPFGLSLVPWLFTKLTKPILEWARSQNIRLDHNIRYVPTSLQPYSNSNSETRIVRMDCQPQEIQSYSDPISRTPRLLIRYQQDDSSTTRQEDPGPSTQHISTIEKVLPLTSSDTQFNHEDTGSYICAYTSTTVHSTLTPLEKPTVRSSIDWDIPQPLPQQCIDELTWCRICPANLYMLYKLH